jgi:hypothetical protein
VLVLALLFGSAARLVADDTEHDIRQTSRARQALLRDPQLAPLNLGVRVRNRVAILWGPVPSAELGFKAERALRSLFELADVYNELEVSGVPGPPAEHAPLPAAPTFLPNQLPPALPARAPTRPAQAAPTPAPAAPALAAPTPAVELPAIEIVLPRVEVLPARLPLSPEQNKGPR